MNQTLIDNLNERVQPKDTLFHLGDWSLSKNRKDKTGNAEEYLNQINCKNIILIPGNHDPHYRNLLPRKEFARLFSECCPFYRLVTELDGERLEIFMFHYACRVWNKSHYGAWHLFGHSHGTLPDLPNSLSLDIGVDANNFCPLNISEIAKFMEKKTFEPIDHHGITATRTIDQIVGPEKYDEWAKKNAH